MNIDKMNREVQEMERWVQRKEAQLKKKQELKWQKTLKKMLKKRLEELKKENARLDQEICEVGKITLILQSVLGLNMLLFSVLMYGIMDIEIYVDERGTLI